ncbi:tRNA uridine-5-carboxymethylaminomethyl(34) synthesis GTPase MnmE [Roseivirga sp. BDSF3-8]|uniref:tRNA uridine-5-carboxymethylaminomethyl(34) synthesis GTPase MnmE n=1 Tax=Roseivirga sp. BDSF3-8 TaxID=3241598 RepID=UPI003532231B
MKQELLVGNDDTIVALATPQGSGAIAVIRVSGNEAISLVNGIFKGKDLEKQDTHTLHFGTIRDGEKILDEVVVSLFVAPKSFTKENVVEISCHGSNFIIREILKLIIRRGARHARPGEFTKRAFMNGAFDLAQAEAIADLIASDNEAAHRAALDQMRGGFSDEISRLREKLVHFASMIELELDFSEEDVEFASREDLEELIRELLKVINRLIDSFDVGNVIKNGVPTVIAGKPNAGKSTLLNAMLQEEKAIVSDIAGTTRDFIEDEMIIQGVSFRFIDTAGLRETTDKIESIGVERTRQKMQQASLIIYMFDLEQDSITEIRRDINKLENLGIPFLKVGNKLDTAQPELRETLENEPGMVFISAKTGENIEQLQEKLLETVNLDKFKTGNTIVTNTRHYESLLETRKSLEDVLEGLDGGITNDFLALDIRQSLHHLGSITGEVSTDEILGNIFSKFCIGK